MHGLALILVGLTVNLGCKSLNVWKEGLISYVVSFSAAVGWEKWEILAGITTLRPELFNTVQQVTTEAMRLITDTVDDILVGFVFMTIFMACILAFDHHFNYEYEAKR
jgi:hypothetical protein